MKLYRASNNKDIPFFFLLSYPFLVCADLYITYLATPDLKQEGNPVIRFFNWGWDEVLLWNCFVVSCSILLVIIFNKYFVNYLKRKTNNKCLFYISCFILSCFYANYVGSIYASPSNYLMYLYLHTKTNHFLYHFAVVFVNLVFRHGSYFYLSVLYSVSFLIGILITVRQINRVKKKETVGY
jgi:hypothetical protein